MMPVGGLHAGRVIHLLREVIVQSNQQRIGVVLASLTSGLLPFFEQEMHHAYGPNWEETARTSFRGHSTTAMLSGKWDAQALLTVMWDQWNSVFRNKLGLAERSLVSELREFRNRWAHQDQFNDDDSYRVHDSAQRLLRAVGASTAAKSIEDHKIEVLRNILGRRLNDDLAAAQYNRARMTDVALYSICCVSIIVTLFVLFGAHQLAPTVIMAAFTIFVFGFFIHKRVATEMPVYGVHECAKCSKVIYSEVCPYCDPPRALSVMRSESSSGFTAIAEQHVRASS